MQLLEDMEKWFADGHETAQYNTVIPTNNQIPSRVWDEFVRRVREAGWQVTAKGAMVIVEMPSRR